MILNDYNHISFDGAYDAGDKLIVSSKLFNGMLEIDKNSNEAEYVCGFLGEKSSALGLHHKVYKYNECLIFIPDNAKGINIYNIREQRMSYYAIDEKYAKRTRCVGAIIVANELWLFYAYAEHPIVVFDLDSLEKSFSFDLLSELPEEILKRTETPTFWSGFEKVENKIYGVIWDSLYVVEIEVNSKNVHIYTVEGDGCRLSDFTYDGDWFWLIEAKNKNVIKWNPQQGIKKRYETDEKFMSTKCTCCNIINNGQKTIILYDDCNYVFYVNERIGKVDVLCAFPEGFKKFADVRKKWRCFFSYDIIDGVVRMYPTNANMMLDIDVSNACVAGYKFVLGKKYDNEWYRKHIFFPYVKERALEGMISESNSITLEDFLECLTCEKAD